MTRSLILFASTFVVVTACGPRWPNETYCQEVNEERRMVEAELRRYEGNTLVFEHTKEEGNLQLEVTIVETLARSTPSPRHPLDVATDLFVPAAFAACAGPEALANVTYTVTWTPTGGQATVMRSNIMSDATFTNTAVESDDEAYGGYVFSVYDAEVLFNVVVSARGEPLSIEVFSDSAAPEANVAPSAE